jgi:hypothetical protein
MIGFRAPHLRAIRRGGYLARRRIWIGALWAVLLFAGAAGANDIESPSWSEAAGANNAASPNGAPEGMAPSGVNDTIREIMAALKRDWDRGHATIASTGSANAYVLAYASAPAAYVDGQQFAFRANFTNSGAATANVNGLGAKAIQKQAVAGLVNLASGDIQSGQHVVLEYDAGLDKLILLTPQFGAGLALPITPTNGGTGLSTLTAHGVLIGEGTGNVVPTAAGTPGQMLSSGGALADPSFANLQLVTTKTADYTLVAADQGGRFVMNSAAPHAITLPDDATVGNGWTVCLVDQGAGALTVARASTDTIASGGSTVLTSIKLSQGDQGCLTADGASHGIFWWQGVRHYDSGQQTITAAGSLTLAHGLGVQPPIVEIYLHCVTAEQNFSVGDESLFIFGPTNNNGLNMAPDASNLSIRIGSSGSFGLLNKTSGVGFVVTNANWKLIFRAYVYN